MLNLETLTKYKEPSVLYHGSAYKQAELKPGYYHSKKVVNWDKYESNIYLYATSDIEAARLLGISSSWEKSFELERTSFDEDKRIINLEFTGVPPTLKDLYGIKAFLYTIKYIPGVWIRNHNPYNNIENEFKTTKTIKDIYSCEPIDISEVIKDFQITIK